MTIYHCDLKPGDLIFFTVGPSVRLVRKITKTHFSPCNIIFSIFYLDLASLEEILVVRNNEDKFSPSPLIRVFRDGKQL